VTRRAGRGEARKLVQLYSTQNGQRDMTRLHGRAAGAAFPTG
jgi:hypothetical protein